MEDLDLIETLDQAVDAVREKGYAADGWTMQRDEDGYAAWIHCEDDRTGTQTYVFDAVEILASPLAAARYCLKRALDLPAKYEDADN